MTPTFIDLTNRDTLNDCGQSVSRFQSQAGNEEAMRFCLTQRNGAQSSLGISQNRLVYNEMLDDDCYALHAVAIKHAMQGLWIGCKGVV
jgi:hypothetical protein